MLTSTSSPKLRLHTDSPVVPSPADAVSADSATALDVFESLDRAFQLATGWTLGCRTRLNGCESDAQIGDLYVADLSDLTYGQAIVGQRYAQNLVGQINIIWQELRELKTLISLDQLDQAVADLTRNAPPKRPRNNRSPSSAEPTGDAQRPGKRKPILTNFEIGVPTHPVVGCHSDWLARSDGSVAIMTARFPNHAHVLAQSTTASATANMAATQMATRELAVAFACLADRSPTAQALQNDLMSVLWQLGTGTVETEPQIIFLHDRSYECEFTCNVLFDQPGLWRIDFNLGTFQPVPMESLHQRRLWVGSDQAVVLLDSPWPLQLEWSAVFDGSVNQAAGKRADEIAALVQAAVPGAVPGAVRVSDHAKQPLRSANGEHLKHCICPIVIRRC